MRFEAPILTLELIPGSSEIEENPVGFEHIHIW